MAADWFPLGYWRSRTPEVVEIASLTGRDRHQVLGLLCDLWSYVSCESVDGTLGGVRLHHLTGVVGADDAFWDAVAAVNWLAEDETGIVVPGWENWLSESAKKRARAVIKKRIQRRKCPRFVPDLSPVGGDKSGTTEDRIQKREEKKKTPLPPAGETATAGRRTGRPDPEAHPLFARFWAAYPRKVARPAAARAFAKIDPPDDLLTRMLDALAVQAKSDQWQRDRGAFIPHPATWLNQRRWEDETAAPRPRPKTPAERQAELRAVRDRTSTPAPLTGPEIKAILARRLNPAEPPAGAQDTAAANR